MSHLRRRIRKGKINKLKTAAIDQAVIEALRVTLVMQQRFPNRNIRVVFHHSRGYDSQRILETSFEVVGADTLQGIPDSSDKFVTSSFGE